MASATRKSRHWLLQDPMSFLNRYEHAHDSTHSSLTLYLFFFVKDKLLLFRKKSANLARRRGRLTTLTQPILFLLDEKGKRCNSASAGHTIRDFILDVLHLPIVKNDLQSLQFADFATTRPVILSADSQALSIAVLLSLDQAPTCSKLKIRDLQDRQRVWKPVRLDNHCSIEALRQQGTLDFPISRNSLERIFGHFHRSAPKEFADDDWIRQLCVNNLDAILAVERMRREGLGERMQEHGFITVNANNIQAGTYIFLEDKELGGRGQATTIVQGKYRFYINAYLEGGVLRLQDKFYDVIDRMRAMLVTGRANVIWMRPHNETRYDAFIQREIAWDEEEAEWRIRPVVKRPSTKGQKLEDGEVVERSPGSGSPHGKCLQT